MPIRASNEIFLSLPQLISNPNIRLRKQPKTIKTSMFYCDVKS